MYAFGSSCDDGGHPCDDGGAGTDTLIGGYGLAGVGGTLRGGGGNDKITLTQGVYLGTGQDTAERLAAAMAQVTERQGETVPRSGSEQGTLEVGKAMKAHGAA